MDDILKGQIFFGALSYGSDHHIPSKAYPILIYTEFKNYFQSIKH